MNQDHIEATLVVCNNAGRLHFLARATRSLPIDEVIVQVRDLVGRRRAFHTQPQSLRAMLVATEPPILLRGGFTALIAYYRVPAAELEAVELHSEGGVESHRYQVRLRVSARGRGESLAVVL